MRRHRTVEVEVDLSDFDAADILAEAARLTEVSGRAAMLGGGPETPAETLFRLVHDLARAIVGDDRLEALYRLDDLVGDNRVLRDAIDMGRRAGAR